MKQKLITLILAFLLLIPPARVQAASPVSVTVDGRALPAGGQLQESTTFVPLRALLEHLGGWLIHWNQESATVTAISEGLTIRAAAGERRIFVNGTEYATDEANYISDGSFYLPLRVLCNALGAAVEWENHSRTAKVRFESADYTEEELFWLARIIYAESGAESLEGQIAVGNVVLNRVASREFPDSIYDVIFDRRYAVQFEPVANGTVYNTPSEQSYTAARMALEGVSVVGDCLYFFAPARSAGSWIVNNRSYYTTIGCHRFYR